MDVSSWPDDINRAWDGKLDEWLSLVLSPKKNHPEWLVSWEFPTDDLKRDYLNSVQDRPDKDIRALIRRFSVPTGMMQADKRTAQHLIWARTNDPDAFKRMLRFESTRRLIQSAGEGAPPPWEGMTWILDLLPYWPREALDAVGAYELAHAQQLPDGRLGGLQDIQAIIRARWIETATDPNLQARKRSALLGLNPREFEHVTESLYHKMGYDTKLTPARGDGGRDVEGSKSTPAERVKILIECKRYTKTVGVAFGRALLGMVSHENVNKGVLVSTGSFTRGLRALSEADHRLELIDGTHLIELLNEHLDIDWEFRLDAIIQGSKVRNPENPK